MIRIEPIAEQIGRLELSASHAAIELREKFGVAPITFVIQGKGEMDLPKSERQRLRDAETHHEVMRAQLMCAMKAKAVAELGGKPETYSNPITVYGLEKAPEILAEFNRCLAVLYAQVNCLEKPGDSFYASRLKELRAGPVTPPALPPRPALDPRVALVAQLGENAGRAIADRAARTFASATAPKV